MYMHAKLQVTTSHRQCLANKSRVY